MNIKKRGKQVGTWMLTVALAVTMIFGTGTLAFADDQSVESQKDAEGANFSEETTELKASESIVGNNSNTVAQTQTTKKDKAATTKAASEQVSDFAQLKTAIANANSGATSEIIITNDIELTDQLWLNTANVNVTIKGKTGNETLINNSGKTAFGINNNGHVTFEDIILDGNRKNNGITETYGTETVVTFDNNSIVKNVGVSETSAPTTAIYFANGSTGYINKGALIADNFSTYGAMYIRNDVAKDTVVHVRGTFDGNVNIGTNHNGGAVSLYNGALILYDGSLFQNNKAIYGDNGGAGGAINLSSAWGSTPGKLIMYGGTIKNNEADADTTVTKKYAKDAGGGGVAVCRAVFVMYGGEITGNKASFGGGVSVNNEGSSSDWAGYFIGLGGTVANNTSWGKSTILGDNNEVPITNNSPDVSAQAWGKAIVSSEVKQTTGNNRVALPFKADINIDVVSNPKDTNIEIRNSHENYVARDKNNEGTALNNAYNVLSQQGKELDGYYQIGFHSTDKTDYTEGRETRWFMATVSTKSFEGLSTPNEENITKGLSYMNELTSSTVHNTANCAPLSDDNGDVQVRVNYPDYTDQGTHDFKVLYIPYDKADGTAGTPQVLTPVEKADGLYITVKGGCRGAFEIEKKAKPATIKFEANGGSGTMANQSVTSVIDYDNTKKDPNSVPGTPLNKNTFTSPGQYYVFAGWSTKPYGLDGISTTSGVGKDYADEEAIRPNAAETITLYAKWEAIATPQGEPAKVVFHGNYTGATPASYEQSVPAGQETALKTNSYLRSGYSVVGWNTKADGTGTNYTLNQKVTLAEKETLDLYAVWEEDSAAKPDQYTSKKYILLPMVKAKGKTAQTISWTRQGDASGYFVYGARCNTGKNIYKFKKLKTIKGNKNLKWTRKHLSKSTKYKYYVAAYKVKNGKKVIMKKTFSVHGVTGNYSSKDRTTNVKKITASKKKATIKVGRTIKVKAKITPAKKGIKAFYESHAAKIRYVSGNKKIATVSKNGVIKGKKKGTVKVYVIGVNGVRTSVSVTVK